MYDLALMGHKRVVTDLVVVRHVGQAALHEVGEKSSDVSRVELAGVSGDVGGEIGRPEDGHAVEHDRFVGP